MHSGKRRGPHGWDVFLHVFTNPSCEEPRNEFTSYKYMCIYIYYIRRCFQDVAKC